MTAEQLRAELTKLWREMADFRCAGSEMTAGAVHMYMQDYAEQLREIAARLSGMAADTWQPIETAPKDGSRTVLWNAKWTGPCTGQFYGETIGWSLHYEFGGFAYQPTHWQPLPAAPERPNA